MVRLKEHSSSTKSLFKGGRSVSRACNFLYSFSGKSHCAARARRHLGAVGGETARWWTLTLVRHPAPARWPSKGLCTLHVLIIPKQAPVCIISFILLLSPSDRVVHRPNVELGPELGAQIDKDIRQWGLKVCCQVTLDSSLNSPSASLRTWCHLLHFPALLTLQEGSYSRMHVLAVAIAICVTIAGLAAVFTIGISMRARAHTHTHTHTCTHTYTHAHAHTDTDVRSIATRCHLLAASQPLFHNFLWQ